MNTKSTIFISSWRVGHHGYGSRFISIVSSRCIRILGWFCGRRNRRSFRILLWSGGNLGCVSFCWRVLASGCLGHVGSCPERWMSTILGSGGFSFLCVLLCCPRAATRLVGSLRITLAGFGFGPFWNITIMFLNFIYISILLAGLHLQCTQCP